MITAYDAPSGRLADEAGADIILVGDSAAMTVLGHDSTGAGDDGRAARAHAGGQPRRASAARRRGHAVRLVPGLGRGGAAQRDPLPQGGRRRRGQGRGRRRDALARARARRRGDPGHGPHRPDAAVGDDARRLQGAGPHRREGAPALRGRARARGGRRLRARARGRARRRSRSGSPRRSRSRPSGSAQAPAATARCSSGTTCSASTRATRRGSSSSTRISRRRSSGRSSAYVADVRERRFPEEQHTYAMPEEELALFEEALEERGEVRRTPLGTGRSGRRRRASATSSSRGRCGCRSRAGARTRGRRRARATVKTSPRRRSSEPPASEAVAAEERELERPEEQQRERERRDREAEHVPRAPVAAEAAEAPRGQVERAADHEVADDRGRARPRETPSTATSVRSYAGSS